jgi:hypothetical protein
MRTRAAMILLTVGIAGCANPSIAPLDKEGTYYHIVNPGGTYETAGSNRKPNADGTIRPCMWSRLTAPDLTIGNTIETGKVQTGETRRVTLKSGDYFIFYSCKPWKWVRG